MIKIETEKIFARKSGDKLLKGKTIYCPNQSAADEWQEFENEEDVYNYFKIEKQNDEK